MTSTPPSPHPVSSRVLDADFDSADSGLAANFSRASLPPQCRIWWGVIERALLDAKLIHGETAPKSTRHGNAATDRRVREALAWLLGGSRDFHQACEPAWLEPEWVRDRAKYLMVRREAEMAF